jgi:hypothetical protein
MILAGDVGGTKIMLEAGDIRSGAWVPAVSRRYESAEMTFVEALGKFLEELKGHAQGAHHGGGLRRGGPLVGQPHPDDEPPVGRGRRRGHEPLRAFRAPSW